LRLELRLSDNQVAPSAIPFDPLGKFNENKVIVPHVAACDFERGGRAHLLAREDSIVVFRSDNLADIAADLFTGSVKLDDQVTLVSCPWL